MAIPEHRFPAFIAPFLKNFFCTPRVPGRIQENESGSQWSQAGPQSQGQARKNLSLALGEIDTNLKECKHGFLLYSQRHTTF